MTFQGVKKDSKAAADDPILKSLFNFDYNCVAGLD